MAHTEESVETTSDFVASQASGSRGAIETNMATKCF